MSKQRVVKNVIQYNENIDPNIIFGEQFGVDWNYVSKESIAIKLPTGKEVNVGDWVIVDQEDSICVLTTDQLSEALFH